MRRWGDEAEAEAQVFALTWEAAAPSRSDASRISTRVPVALETLCPFSSHIPQARLLRGQIGLGCDPKSMAKPCCLHGSLLTS